MYNVKAQKIEPGRYLLSYGKGRKKLTQEVAVDNGDWSGGGFAAGSLRKIKELWGTWAMEAYKLAPNQRREVLRKIAADNLGCTVEVDDDIEPEGHDDPLLGEWRSWDAWKLVTLYRRYGVDEVLRVLTNIQNSQVPEKELGAITERSS